MVYDTDTYWLDQIEQGEGNMRMLLSERLKSKQPLLYCGAVGSELISRGSPAPSGISNLLNPDMVSALDQEYRDAGAEVLRTNTFSMNRVFAKTHLKGHDYREINLRGCQITRKVAGDDLYVLGNMGPTGEMLPPLGTADPDDVYKAFREQAELLLQDGCIDGFTIMTFYSLPELELAVQAVRDVSELPIAASLVLNAKGRTMMGDSLEGAYKTLAPYNISLLGHNCGDITGKELAVVFEQFTARNDIDLIAFTNGGLPKLQEGKTVYDMPPEEFAENNLPLLKMGVKMIGGCCGTNPSHIASLAKLFKQITI